MDLNFDDILKRTVEEAFRERGHVNILIAGRTGVGKSSLINAVFQGKMADTGQGKPVTDRTREYSKSGVPLTLFDTRGYELTAYRETIGELKKVVADRRADRDLNRHIHVAWLCIQEDGRRIEEAEVELHEMLADYMPVIGVVTKSRSDNGFKAEVQSLLPRARNVIRVRAIKERLDDGHELLPQGLEELVDITKEVIPEGHQRAFIAVQKASIKQKRDTSHKIVATAATSAAGVAAAPLPFADAVALVPLQIGMLAGISATFGLELSKSFLMTLVSSAIGSGGAVLVGRIVFANLLKLVPGGGSVTGGVIAAATAATLTTALGEAYIATLSTLYQKSGGEPVGPEEIIKELKKRIGKGA